MQALEKQQALSALRDKIAGIVDLSPAQGGTAQNAITPVRDALTAPAGLLHEVFTDDRRNGGAALGFTLGAARALLTPERLAILFLQLGREAHDVGLPYGAGLKSFGIDPQTLILGRVETLPELMWAMEEAICCRAVAAVIADVAGHPKILDFTASRRLGLRTASAGTSAFILRYGREREASAAKLRWRVHPLPSLPAVFDPRAPGKPRWQVTLEKGRLHSGQTEFIVDWTQNGFELAHPHPGEQHRPAPAAGAAPSGAQPAALGHRLPKAG